MSAKELATTRLTVNANEVFKMGKKLFVPSSVLSVVFNSKGATRKFDKDLDVLVHPKRGRLFMVPKNVEQFITVV